MSGYPIVLHGEKVRALIVGGGNVAARKALTLIEAGANVHFVAPVLTPELRRIVDSGKATWAESPYDHKHIGDANLVFAATDSPVVNSLVARDAHERDLMVNVASDPDEGDFSTPATHVSGPLLISVYAGGAPAAATRIRDVLRDSVDERIGSAVQRLVELRRARLARGDAAGWNAASREMLGEDFLESVASGEFERRFSRWG